MRKKVYCEDCQFMPTGTTFDMDGNTVHLCSPLDIKKKKKKTYIQRKDKDTYLVQMVCEKLNKRGRCKYHKPFKGE